ncbi:SAF domain-containing protein [Humibacter sp. RRB41]|uniref:SAF domain-containing protein n=1 Tax=Humibacter sp. RRB41 TaxID=2919946 RepID=UPI001FA98822|nr:SAF domain-containing protein [Humibacter sp. RRB41]
MSTANGARQRRFWVDPRFAVGILLIVASVVGVCVLLAAQNRSVEVYVARSTLVAGDHVRAGDLELASVRVPSASDVYLTRAAMPKDAVVVRSVPKGELVPAAAVSERTDAALTSVVVKASGPVAAAVTDGAVVDVWAAHGSDDKDYRPPTVLVPGAVVVSFAHDDALVADRATVSIEVRMPSSRVAAVLQAIADGQALSVVPASPDSGVAASSDASEDDGDGSDVDATPATPIPTPTPTASRSDGSRSGSGK